MSDDFNKDKPGKKSYAKKPFKTERRPSTKSGRGDRSERGGSSSAGSWGEKRDSKPRGSWGGRKDEDRGGYRGKRDSEGGGFGRPKRDGFSKDRDSYSDRDSRPRADRKDGDYRKRDSFDDSRPSRDDGSERRGSWGGKRDDSRGERSPRGSWGGGRDRKEGSSWGEKRDSKPRGSWGDRKEGGGDRSERSSSGSWGGDRRDRGDRGDRRGGSFGRDRRSDRSRDDRRENRGERRDERVGFVKAEIAEGNYLLYGKHPVLLALKNPNRKIKKIYASKNSLQFLTENLGEETLAKYKVTISETKDMDNLFERNSGVTHQGLVAEVSLLAAPTIEEVAERSQLIVALDKVTDPHNVGAIIRSCAAFGVNTVITKEENSPRENATIAKTSAGCIEFVSYAQYNSLVKSLGFLKEQGFQIIGLSGEADTELSKLKKAGKAVLVVGSEGQGLTREVAALCDNLVKIEISDTVESLNASVATSIALYNLK